MTLLGVLLLLIGVLAQWPNRAAGTENPKEA
jgi:hypothetical protein